MEQELLEKVDKNSEDIKNLNNSVMVLEEKVDRNSEDIKSLNKSVTVLDEKVDNKVNELNKKIDMLEEKMDKNFEEIRKSLLLIEDCVTNKIPALFDGYTAHQEKIDTTDKEVENIKEVSQNHSIRISVLESKSEEHSKQISKLLV